MLSGSSIFHLCSSHTYKFGKGQNGLILLSLPSSFFSYLKTVYLAKSLYYFIIFLLMETDWFLVGTFMLLLRTDLEIDNGGEGCIRVWVYHQISLLSSSQNIEEVDSILPVNNPSFRTQLPRPLYCILLTVNTLLFTTGYFLAGTVCQFPLLSKTVPMPFALELSWKQRL